MTVYRIQLTDGTTHTLDVSRMVAEPEELLFQKPRNGKWHTTQSWPLDCVDGVHRRITELNGTWQWIPVSLDPGR